MAEPVSAPAPGAAAATDAPLPPGWTQHVGPQGQTYYWHKQSKTSTYKRPTADPAPPPTSGSSAAAAPVAAPQVAGADLQQPAASTSSAPKKKEKPKRKDAIPGADGWLRVTTNLGNVFYTNAETRRSEWKVPEEIKVQVRALEKREKEEAERELLAASKRQNGVHQGRRQEPPRLSKEEEEERKRAEAERQEREYREAVKQELQAQAAAEEAAKKKRKGSAGADAEEDRTPNSKRRKVDDDKRDDASQEEDESEEDEDEGEWQRKIAAEMAAEIGAPTPAAPSAKSIQAAAAKNAHSHPAAAPLPQVELSSAEATAIFTQMLTSLNGTPSEVDPMAPWDRELPKFVSHPQYLVLKSLKDREDAFNEWCKLRIRQRRAERANASANASGARGAVASNGRAAAASPSITTGAWEQAPTAVGAAEKEAFRAAYLALLQAEVTSTRTRWEDFRKSFKKDRRFFSFGRDDKEREKVFKQHLKQLGEEKKKKALQADADFVTLLEEFIGQEDEDVRAARDKIRSLNDGREEGEAEVGKSEIEQIASEHWTKAKKKPGLDKDPRYDAVGSSSRRAELWRLWLIGEAPRPDRSAPAANGGTGVAADAQGASGQNKKKDAQDALREREEQVRREKARLEGANRKALSSAAREDSTIQFQQMLIDLVRDPLTEWRMEEPRLSRDPRFESPGLHFRDKQRMFEDHVASLVDKRKKVLYAVFERAADTLDVSAQDAAVLIIDDPETERLNLLSFMQDQAQKRSGRGKKIPIEEALDIEFDSWQAKRTKEARAAFQEMLKENTFVQFWGRLRQSRKQQEGANPSGGEGGATAPKGGLAGGEDDDDELEKDVVDMVEDFDLNEVHAVLATDPRYKAFAHKPEKREEWIKVSRLLT